MRRASAQTSESAQGLRCRVGIRLVDRLFSSWRSSRCPIQGCDRRTQPHLPLERQVLSQMKRAIGVIGVIYEETRMQEVCAPPVLLGFSQSSIRALRGTRYRADTVP